MTAPVPAHGDQHPSHHPMPGAPAPAPAPIDYTGGTAAPAGYQPVPVDSYDAAAAAARERAEQAARDQLAQQQVQHPDDRRVEPGVAVADMRAEVAHEQAAPTVDEPERVPTPEGAFEVTLTTRLGTDTVRILDPTEWPSSANSSLHVGEYESWAEGCLVEGDHEQVWMRLDPTLGDVNRMFEEWRRVSGRDQGKSRQSPASLRRAAKK